MSTHNQSIVVLSTFNSEYAPFVLKEIYALGFSVRAMILDGEVVERDRRIQEERTRGFFEWPDFFSIEKYEIPLYAVKNHNGDRSLALLAKLAPDIIVNGGTPRILKTPLLSIPTQGVISAHPGLLPDYRGCTCVEWALYNNDPVGITCHFVSEGIDDGPIICQEPLPIARGDSYEKVRASVVGYSAQVLARGLRKVVDEGLSRARLPLQGEGTYYTVIPQDKLEGAKEKLITGTYAHYTRP